MASVQVKRGTRAQLETAKTASGLLLGEPYLVTDENRLAVGTAVNAYSDAALKSEVDAKLPLISSQTEIGAALVDDDVVAVYDTSATAHCKGLMSRVWTYISGKLTGAISGVLTSNLTASRALVSDGSGKLAVSAATSTELGYLSGVTSAVQTQINAKASLSGYNTFTQPQNIICNSENSVFLLLQNTITSGKSWSIYSSGGGPSAVGSFGVYDNNLYGNRFLISATSGNIILGGNVDDASGAKLQVSGTVNLAPGSAYKINNVQIISARKTGWTAATGTATRNTFDTSTVTTEQLAQRVKALLDDLLSHGLIGS